MRSVAMVTVTTCDFRFRAETDMHRADCLTWTIIQTGANWRIRWIDFRQCSSTRKIASRVVQEQYKIGIYTCKLIWQQVAALRTLPINIISFNRCQGALYTTSLFAFAVPEQACVGQFVSKCCCLQFHPTNKTACPTNGPDPIASQKPAKYFTQLDSEMSKVWCKIIRDDFIKNILLSLWYKIFESRLAYGQVRQHYSGTPNVFNPPQAAVRFLQPWD